MDAVGGTWHVAAAAGPTGAAAAGFGAGRADGGAAGGSSGRFGALIQQLLEALSEGLEFECVASVPESMSGLAAAVEQAYGRVSHMSTGTSSASWGLHGGAGGEVLLDDTDRALLDALVEPDEEQAAAELELALDPEADTRGGGASDDRLRATKGEPAAGAAAHAASPRHRRPRRSFSEVGERELSATAVQQQQHVALRMPGSAGDQGGATKAAPGAAGVASTAAAGRRGAREAEEAGGSAQGLPLASHMSAACAPNNDSAGSTLGSGGGFSSRTPARPPNAAVVHGNSTRSWASTCASAGPTTLDSTTAATTTIGGRLLAAGSLLAQETPAIAHVSSPASQLPMRPGAGVEAALQQQQPHRDSALETPDEGSAPAAGKPGHGDPGKGVAAHGHAAPSFGAPEPAVSAARHTPGEQLPAAGQMDQQPVWTAAAAATTTLAISPGVRGGSEAAARPAGAAADAHPQQPTGQPPAVGVIAIAGGGGGGRRAPSGGHGGVTAATLHSAFAHYAATADLSTSPFSSPRRAAGPALMEPAGLGSGGGQHRHASHSAAAAAAPSRALVLLAPEDVRVSGGSAYNSPVQLLPGGSASSSIALSAHQGVPSRSVSRIPSIHRNPSHTMQRLLQGAAAAVETRRRLLRRTMSEMTLPESASRSRPSPAAAAAALGGVTGGAGAGSGSSGLGPGRGSRGGHAADVTRRISTLTAPRPAHQPQTQSPRYGTSSNGFALGPHVTSAMAAAQAAAAAASRATGTPCAAASGSGGGAGGIRNGAASSGPRFIGRVLSESMYSENTAITTGCLAGATMALPSFGDTADSEALVGSLMAGYPDNNGGSAADGDPGRALNRRELGAAVAGGPGYQQQQQQQGLSWSRALSPRGVIAAQAGSLLRSAELQVMSSGGFGESIEARAVVLPVAAALSGGGRRQLSGRITSAAALQTLWDMDDDAAPAAVQGDGREGLEGRAAAGVLGSTGPADPAREAAAGDAAASRASPKGERVLLQLRSLMQAGAADPFSGLPTLSPPPPPAELPTPGLVGGSSLSMSAAAGTTLTTPTGTAAGKPGVPVSAARSLLAAVASSEFASSSAGIRTEGEDIFDTADGRAEPGAGPGASSNQGLLPAEGSHRGTGGSGSKGSGDAPDGTPAIEPATGNTSSLGPLPADREGAAVAAPLPALPRRIGFSGLGRGGSSLQRASMSNSLIARDFESIEEMRQSEDSPAAAGRSIPQPGLGMSAPGHSSISPLSHHGRDQGASPHQSPLQLSDSLQEADGIPGNAEPAPVEMRLPASLGSGPPIGGFAGRGSATGMGGSRPASLVSTPQPIAPASSAAVILAARGRTSNAAARRRSMPQLVMGGLAGAGAGAGTSQPPGIELVPLVGSAANAAAGGVAGGSSHSMHGMAPGRGRPLASESGYGAHVAGGSFMVLSAGLAAGAGGGRTAGVAAGRRPTTRDRVDLLLLGSRQREVAVSGSGVAGSGAGAGGAGAGGGGGGPCVDRSFRSQQLPVISFGLEALGGTGPAAGTGGASLTGGIELGGAAGGGGSTMFMETIGSGSEHASPSAAIDVESSRPGGLYAPGGGSAQWLPAVPLHLTSSAGSLCGGQGGSPTVAPGSWAEHGARAGDNGTAVTSGPQPPTFSGGFTRALAVAELQPDPHDAAHGRAGVREAEPSAGLPPPTRQQSQRSEAAGGMPAAAQAQPMPAGAMAGSAPPQHATAPGPAVASTPAGNVPPTKKRCWHRVHVALSHGAAAAAGGHEDAAAEQQHREGDVPLSSRGGGRTTGRGRGRSMVLTITQVDVTEVVEAQAQLTKLLEREHKVLESIYPRHVIEFLALHTNDAESEEAQRRERRERQAHRHSGEDRAGGGADTSHHAAAPAATGSAGTTGRGDSGPGGGNVARMASLATWHQAVTVLFADIVGFTTMCQTTAPLTVMAFLNNLFSRFDGLVDIYKVYKVETIGDCYMVAGGLVAHDDDGYKSVISEGEDPLHAVRVMEFAKAMLRASREVQLPHSGEPLEIRIGLHSGSVVSGVVGERMPRFCLFGDTVNTASRMESTARPGTIHVSAATRARLPNEAWRDRGLTQVKGKGDMRTYEWMGDGEGASAESGQQLKRLVGLYL
ncbi:hypothetical protein HXX76_008385 [Chlamydomonas incerta]|uniref:Guanylate cyclase domain-containing protein n=1 Tax=Chlamydomonas incerta TaxID=51695 RepID=A0A835W184_CHLIN|nr:hypothetical protein HXX76_008385 [Chlamydomonas incerta]|eukprot:KAG2433319.1 hypothetical protein HXX76_008385 [Chlamydomonas incerta]